MKRPRVIVHNHFARDRQTAPDPEAGKKAEAEREKLRQRRLNFLEGKDGTQKRGRMEVEFDKKPGRHSIPSEADAHVEAVAKRLKLWDGKSADFPHFTLYEDGEWFADG